MRVPEQWISSEILHQNHLVGLLNPQCWAPPKAFCFVRLGGKRELICISNSFLVMVILLSED